MATVFFFKKGISKRVFLFHLCCPRMGKFTTKETLMIMVIFSNMKVWMKKIHPNVLAQPDAQC
jgi:hypothetical protein